MADPVTLGITAGLTTLSHVSEGIQAEKAAKLEAKQMEAQGKADIAQASQEAFEAARQGDILLSDQRAAMAASGGVTTDAGNTEIAARTARDIEFNVLSKMFAGESALQDANKRASVRRWEGKQQRRASYLRGLTSAISGGGKTYRAYKGA